MRQREARHTVRLRARMRTLAGWSDVGIRNVSRHGMLLRASPAPQPGSYIEVRRDRLVMVARAIWRDGDLFGVRTQDPIDLEALQNEPPAVPPIPGAVVVERRRERRDPDTVAARASAFGHRLQFAALALTMAAAAIVGASMLTTAFAAPLATVRGALRGGVSR